VLDYIPEAQLASVVGMLEKMLDPLSLALLNAPFDDEPVTEEEAREIAEAEEWLKHNKGIPHDEAMRRLGLL
jgi:hypothetical protein